ncbi:MAG: outer membrane beta-barrel protein [Polyangiales bacterium]|jgi:outer membrane beta-barrel protein
MRFLSMRLLLVALTLVAVNTFTANQASAQEVQVTGPLANQPAVRNMRLYRAGRFQLEPNFSFGLQSEYSRPMVAGLHLGYYFTDWLGIGLWGGYSVASLDTGLTDEISGGGITTDRNRLSLPNRDGFSEQIGRIQWMAALQLEFSPLRGKLAIFEKLFVDTDLYLFVGAAVIGLEERGDTSNAANTTGACMGAGSVACYNASQVARASRVTAAATFGVGLSMYFNDFIGLNLNWRGMPFSWNASGWDDSSSMDGTDFGDGVINSDDRFFRLNHLFTVGIVVYLPTAPEITD